MYLLLQAGPVLTCGCLHHARQYNRIIWIHNGIYKETYKKKIINEINITCVHWLHNQIYKPTNKLIRLPGKKEKTNYCFTCVFSIPAPCFLMCMMFYVFLIWIRVYAFAIHFMVHSGSAFEPGASGLPYYCTYICVCFWCNWRASCVDSKTKTKNFPPNHRRRQKK